MTYAREMATKAVSASRAGAPIDYGATKAVEEVIAEVIERCAQEADRGQCGGDCCEAQCSSGARIRYLTKARP